MNEGITKCSYLWQKNLHFVYQTIKERGVRSDEKHREKWGVEGRIERKERKSE
jgi:hypothetical protein